MKAFLKPLLMLFSALLFSAAFSEPPNLALVTKEIISWHDSGAYEKELGSVLARAREYIAQQVAINNQAAHKKNLAIVLDIDETSLANYQDLAKGNFRLTHNQFHEAILAAH